MPKPRTDMESALGMSCKYTHTYSPLCVASPPRADLNFLTHFTGKGGPST